jgi:hypothetical protein
MRCNADRAGSYVSVLTLRFEQRTLLQWPCQLTNLHGEWDWLPEGSSG